MPIQELERCPCLALRRSAQTLLDGQVSQKSVDLLLAKFIGMA
jgi:hypothetical protein